MSDGLVSRGSATRQRTLAHRAAAAALLLIGAVAVACGGDDDQPRFSPEQAERIVQLALLSESDLPTGEWTVTEGVAESDEEGEDDDLFEGIPACSELQRAFEEFEAGTASVEKLASAERSFESSAGPIVQRQVEAGVSVFPRTENVQQALEGLSAIFTADRVRPCFEAAFSEAFEGDDVAITRIDIVEPEFTLPGGVAVAVNLDVLAVIIPINVTMEFHFFGRAEVGASLAILEMNSTLLADGQREILEAFADRIETALDDG